MPGLQVIEIFDSLQGEGFWTGTPMTFVRLAGCNAPELGLTCARWCDTSQSWDPGAGTLLEPTEIVARASLPRLCLTGGEPLLQLEGVVALLGEAHARGVKVHLETNGTAARPAGGEDLFDWAVVSPKPAGYFIASSWDGLVDELKIVVDRDLDAAIAERLAARHPEAMVSIQPVWEGVPAPEGSSLSRAVRLVMEHPTWRLSLQMHKYLSMR